MELGSHLMPKFLFILNLTLHIHFLCLQRDVSLLLQIWLCVRCDSSVDWKNRLTNPENNLLNKSEKCPIKVRAADTLSTFPLLLLPISSSKNKIEIFIDGERQSKNYLFMCIVKSCLSFQVKLQGEKSNPNDAFLL